MKLYKNQSLLLVFFLSAAVAGISRFDEIAEAFRSGDAEKVSVFFSERIEIHTGQASDGLLSKEVAESHLNRFFKSNPVKSFEWQHRGPSGATSFAIGKMVSTGGQTFRVNVYLKTEKGQSLISELRIEKN